MRGRQFSERHLHRRDSASLKWHGLSLAESLSFELWLASKTERCREWFQMPSSCQAPLPMGFQRILLAAGDRKGSMCVWLISNAAKRFRQRIKSSEWSERVWESERFAFYFHFKTISYTSRIQSLKHTEIQPEIHQETQPKILCINSIYSTHAPWHTYRWNQVTSNEIHTK